ncbi:biliverdin-producing heme oxygenase [Methylobacterium organophilum]|uniref:biliverdin-producing heme oxygenase n=1 Tax=Methylobacterium organophilum TaxID=410 RepID=UPI003B847597
MHERLRAATAPAHAALERDLNWEAQIATLPGYRGLLERLRGFHETYETAIGAALADDAFFAPRRRLALLDADLAHLGLDPGRILRLPAPAAPAWTGPAAAMGALYVLEGSTLGGQVIGRSLAQRHGFASTGGAAYYGAHGRAIGAMWRSFLERLESGLQRESCRDAVLASAIETFEAMRTWLVPPLSAAPPRR